MYRAENSMSCSWYSLAISRGRTLCQEPSRHSRRSLQCRPRTGILIYAGFLPGAGNNAFNGVPGYSAATGWDLASGWGTPNLGKLVGELAKQEVDSNQRTGFFLTRAGTARAGQPGSGLTICAGPGRINSPLRCRPAATAGRRLRCCGCSRQSRSPADERSAASPHAASR